jgi:Flp pilus assembly pilin Flp
VFVESESQQLGDCIVIKRFVSRFVDERGQDTTEFGLLGAFISVVSILAVQEIGPVVENLYDNVQKALLQ